MKVLLHTLWIVPAIVILGFVTGRRLSAQTPTALGYERQRDVIYGRRSGLALTMDVFTPKAEKNGAAIFFMVSGGFFSSVDAINPAFVEPFVKRGYTVFCVVHGSQPVFTVPDAVADVNRAVRYVRLNCAKFGVDPERFGVAGASAGGHLSLMLGCAGGPGDPQAKDPVDRASSKVHAVACFFPPSDFLNFGKEGNEMLGPFKHNLPFRPAFDHHVMDRAKGVFERITDEAKLREIEKSISPIYFVSANSAPTLIIHGDKDTLVPIQQAEIFVARMKEAKTPAELIVRKGQGHGWPTLLGDLALLADWFDKYLPAKVEVKKAG